jgi:glycosyltransferase involved in cell wall biosynthesis
MADVPAVSVVIPLYNKGPYIARALNSVLAQTVQDFEVIVVDDGSTDDGAAVVRGFDDPRIRLIQQENQGVSAARNRGIEAARAELVAFLDADDEWLPGFLRTILRLRTLYPDAGLYGTAYEEHFPSSVVQRVYMIGEGDRLLSSYFNALVNFGSLVFNSSSFAAPKEILIMVGGYPLGVKWNEDGTLWGKIALQFPVAYSSEVCSRYHRYTENNSTRIIDYLENPFIQYVSTIPRDELLRRSDAESLGEYLDLCRLTTVSRNIYSGHGARARRELSSVKSPRYTWKKYKLLIYSYIPRYGIDFIRNYAKVLLTPKEIIHERW